MLDIPPPKTETAEKEIVTYSKEVQTSTWVQEEDSEDDGEEVVQRRVEEEVRRELDKLKLEEQRMKEEEAVRQQVEKEVPGMVFCVCVWLIVVISEEEQQRILTSEPFHDFLSRSSKIVERALDEDYDVLMDYTMDVEANQ
jgi:dynein intermediate chain